MGPTFPMLAELAAARFSYDRFPHDRHSNHLLLPFAAVGVPERIEVSSFERTAEAHPMPTRPGGFFS